MDVNQVNYFIKEGYQINNQLNTPDELTGGNYWNDNRIYSSKLFQYGVYIKASKYLQKIKGEKTVIDLGCGTGEKLKIINGKVNKLNIIGIDQKSGVEYCKSNHSFGKFYTDDLENPSLDSFQGDLIICADVIEHLMNPENLITYIKDTLIKPKGILILSTPERDLLHGSENNKPKNKFHIREWNSKELAQFIQSQGFKIIEHSYQYPIKIGLNRLMKPEILNRLRAGKKLKYNQVVVASPKP